MGQTKVVEVEIDRREFLAFIRNFRQARHLAAVVMDAIGPDHSAAIAASNVVAHLEQNRAIIDLLERS